MKKATKPPKQSTFDSHTAEVQQRMHDLADQLESGDITSDQWADAMDSALLDGHTAAYTLGRQRSGVSGDQNADDEHAGLAAKESQSTFLNSFLQDIDGGKYTGEDGALDANAIKNRASQYLGAMRGTANVAFVDHSVDDAEFTWELGATEDHCEDCPQMADLSPYSKGTLWTTPGAGDTDCLGNCTCSLVRDDGTKGFARAVCMDPAA
jgi:hypothetical protein